MLDTAFFLERVIPALNAGLAVSAQIIVPSALFGFLGGVLLGVIRVYAPAPLRVAGNAYTALFRGVPLVVQLFLVYNGLPKIGMNLDGIWAAVSGVFPAGMQYQGEEFKQLFLLEAFGASIVVFSLCSAAYQSEYIRGALLSIKQGQIRAAQALGFSTWQLLWSVVVPQALRRALPGCGNEVIYLIKYSSLAYLISCIELTGEAKVLAARSYRYTEVFLAVGCYYLALTTLASFILNWLEKRFAIPGFGGGRS